MNCDLCGKESELIDAIIEGSRVSVCKLCSKFGKVVYLKKPNFYYKNKPKKKLIINKTESVEFITKNYSQLIKNSRESLNLEQKKLAKMIGISDVVIGLTIVALGTSLSELSATIACMRKHEHDLALGNIVGSNMFNLLGVLGISATIKSYDLPENFL